MKRFLLFLLAALPVAATAQKLEAKLPPITYRVGEQESPIYRTPADTTHKAHFHLAANEQVSMVGQLSPRWLIIKHQGYLYLTPSALLISPDAPLPQPKLLDGTLLPYDEQTHRITYEGVVEVAGQTKDQLYVRAHEWVAKAYRSANAVIQMQDKEAGRLVAKGVIRATLPILGTATDAGIVRHTLTIYVKDGRYKYVLTDFEHEDLHYRATSIGRLEQPYQDLPFGVTRKQWDALRREADADAKKLVGELQAAMTLKGAKDPSDF